MVHNVGSVDRIVRIVVAAAAIGIAAAVGFGSIGGVVLLVVAAIMAAARVGGSGPLDPLGGGHTLPVPQR